MALIEKLSAIGDAIREKTNTTEKLTLDEMPRMISMISGEGESIKPYINFYDWDGTLLHQYTLSEFANLEALPELPDNLPGHTAVEWNYDMETILAMQSHVNVGAIYNQNDTEKVAETPKTDPVYVDGTKLHLHITKETNVTLYIRQSVTNGVSIIWGDGESSGAGTGYGTTDISVSHKYAPGDYTISFVLADGCKLTLGQASSSRNVLGSSSINENISIQSVKALIAAEIDLRNTIVSYGAFKSCYMLKSVVFGDGEASELNSYAFQYCYALEDVTLSNSITKLDAGVFSNCTALRNIDIPASVTYLNSSNFEICYALESVTIHGVLTSLGNYTFRDCRALKNVSIAYGLTSIGTQVFYNCYGLKKIALPNSITSIGSEVFRCCYSLKDVRLPAKLKTLGSNVFYSCTMLRHIALPNELTGISAYAFQNCSALQYIALPKTVLTINDCAFQDCYALKNAVLPQTIQTLKTNSFSGCTAMEYIVIPPSIASIATQCYVGCMCLKNVVIPESLFTMPGILRACYMHSAKLKEIYKTALETCAALRSNCFYQCLYFDSVTLRSELQTIAEYAFAGNPVLKHLMLVEGLKIISAYAFQNDYVLQDFEFPESLTSIGTAAFTGCKSLKNVTIPANVTSYGNSAFTETGIESIVFKAKSVNLGGAFFSNCRTLELVDFSAVRELVFNGGVFNTTGIRELKDLPDKTTIASTQLCDNCYNLVAVDIHNLTVPTTDIGYSFRQCTALKTVILPKGIRYIGNETFNGDINLQKVENTESLEHIGQSAFNNCRLLENITLGNKLKTIKGSAFYYCCSLRKLYIPYSVTYMESCLTSCYGLEDIYMYPLSVPEGNTTGIGDRLSSDYVIHVPKGYLTAYEEKWTNHAGHFEEFEFITVSKMVLTRYVLLSATSITVRNQIVNSYFDQDQTFTITANYTGTNLQSIDNPVFDYKAGTITFDLEKVESVDYTAVEKLTVHIAVDGKDISCDFAVNLRYAQHDILLEYDVTDVSGRGFVKNDDGSYESACQGVHGSYAVCKLTFRTSSPILYLDCVSDGEGGCDFGIVSNLDCTLQLNGNSDTGESVKRNFTGSPDRKVEALEFEIPDEEEHFIYLKYRKDGSVNRGADSLRFKVRSVYDE